MEATTAGSGAIPGRPGCILHLGPAPLAARAGLNPQTTGVELRTIMSFDQGRRLSAVASIG